jgi:hypothetical protein
MYRILSSNLKIVKEIPDVFIVTHSLTHPLQSYLAICPDATVEEVHGAAGYAMVGTTAIFYT